MLYMRIVICTLQKKNSKWFGNIFAVLITIVISITLLADLLYYVLKCCVNRQ